MITVFLPDIMMIKGKRFHGSTTYVNKPNTLSTVTGSSSWFTEFETVRFPAIQIFNELLFLFHTYDFCRFMTGSFVDFTAIIKNFFGGVTFFMVLDDHPILK